MGDTTIQLPETLARRLEDLAKAEGVTIDVLLRRFVSEHGERRRHLGANRKLVDFPLISLDEARVILPVSGADIDEMFARDHLAS